MKRAEPVAASVARPAPAVAAAWEATCRRCGASCHVAVPIQGRTVVVPGLHCQFLAADGPGRFRCTVYADRFARAPWCHAARDVVSQGFLADDCPYGTPAGMGKVRLTDAEFDAVWPAVLRKLRSWGVPTYIGRAALLAEVARRQGEPWALEAFPGFSDRLRLVRVHLTPEAPR
ncbi:MAG: hypothetical protein EXR79_01225 [Myxococcales bacterium]|nr:hypothetical protein [Myxococcales bacterium]